VTRAPYLASDAEPAADTFIGHPTPPANDVVAEAIARAHAARLAIRELDGELPDQPLAVTVRRTPSGAIAEHSALEVAAFAVGDRCVHVPLAASVEAEHELAATLAGLIRGAPSSRAQPITTPFVTVSLGDEPIATARHGHRRGWHGHEVARGPWLGLGRTDGLATFSTCHMVVDGFGHAWLSARIAEHAARLIPRVPVTGIASAPAPSRIGYPPLEMVWCALEARGPRAVPLAYALGRWLHQFAGRPDARTSPMFQIPVAPGARTDTLRVRRRVVPAVASVRFTRGEPEPFEQFATRTRNAIEREATGAGVVSRLVAIARLAPAPLAWKRRVVAAGRPRWLDRVAELLGSRACVSYIHMADATPPACAVSSPAQDDGWVVTVVEGGNHAAITLCGKGASQHRLTQLLALLPT
jgi:hypothetical protein